MDLYMKSRDDINNPYFAPLISNDLSNQPKTLIITAEYDPLRDEGEEYGKKLRNAGNNVEIYRIKEGLHGFFALPPRFPQVKLCYDIINQFLCEVN
jgi:acetyl esterase/lipase